MIDTAVASDFQPVASQLPQEISPIQPVASTSSRDRVKQLLNQGLTHKDVAMRLGITRQRVSYLAKLCDEPGLPPVHSRAIAGIENAIQALTQVSQQARKSMAEISADTRASLAATFESGARRAKRRMEQVEADDDDAAAKTVLETAKLATEGAAKVHGWDQMAPGGPVLVGSMDSLREAQQVIDVQEVKTEQGQVKE